MGTPRQGKILLFECGRAADWAAMLREQMAAPQPVPLVIRHEHAAVPESSTVQAKLLSTVRSFKPDLTVLLLAPERTWDGVALVAAAAQQESCGPIVVVADADEPGLFTRFFEAGASDFIQPPLRRTEVWPRLSRLLRFHEAQSGDAAELKQRLGLERLIGDSPVLLTQIAKIPMLARCNATVLVTGETGTGKELCARAIHYLSPRSTHPFVALNAGAIPPELAENELFGHEPGAFTSANRPQPGAAREAEGGTLFLDEVDNLPTAVQVKLLRFLQEKEFRPLGGRQAIRADLRIIAACNTSLEQAVLAGRFRQDLFYRLNVLRLQLPPLRERLEDVPLLARYFLNLYAAEFDKTVRDFAPQALHQLAGYHWPGNVRELENVVERAVALSRGLMIHAGDLELPLERQQEKARAESFQQLKARVVADFEQNYIMDLLQRHGGNIAQAARAAQKNRRAFFQLMRKHRMRINRGSQTAGGVANAVIEVDQSVHPVGDGSRAMMATGG